MLLTDSVNQPARGTTGRSALRGAGPSAGEPVDHIADELPAPHPVEHRRTATSGE
ncbi:hypothetical protein ACGFOU_29655 [Streptomyces sp. NPDC048595]|uniref:hypothetical protein n=1 Tax=Streptomyces sp. NPDC048595 TaxID=3365576 RepID=UPI003717DADB